MKRSFFGDFVAVRIMGAIILSLLFSVVARAQQETSVTQSEKSPQTTALAPTESKPAGEKPKPAFKLKVAREPILNVSLKAEKARLTEIAEVLEKQLKTTVLVAPVLGQHLVSIEFDELMLEPAMQLLAPSVYIDYEIQTAHPESPKVLGVFFYPADQEPPTTAVVPSSSQSLLIEGDTEEGVEPTTEEEKQRLEAKPLRIQFKDNRISIKAKRQPLPLILLEVGEELGIPVDIKFDALDAVDIELNKVTVEEAMRQLSPNITVFIRSYLAHSERRAIKLTLNGPEVSKPEAGKPEQVKPETKEPK